MIQKINYYESDRNETPVKLELQPLLADAKLYNHINQLNWYIPYSGWYHVKIYPEDHIGNVLDRLPKTYPV